MSDYTLATTEGKHCNYLTGHHESSKITQLNHTGDCNFSWTVNNQSIITQLHEQKKTIPYVFNFIYYFY